MRAQCEKKRHRGRGGGGLFRTIMAQPWNQVPMQPLLQPQVPLGPHGIVHGCLKCSGTCPALGKMQGSVRQLPCCLASTGAEAGKTVCMLRQLRA
jgi:hypothetical protein